MRLLLDECIGDRSLALALKTAGHDVARSIDVLGGGADDPAVFEYARADDRVLVTFNIDDFRMLAEQTPVHPGMLLIYQDGSPADMSSREIIKSIANVEATLGDRIASQVLPLNSYRW